MKCMNLDVPSPVERRIDGPRPSQPPGDSDHRWPARLRDASHVHERSYRKLPCHACCGVPIRYARAAVSWKRAAFLSGEKALVIRLKEFQSTR